MLIEARGANFVNKGAELMLHAVRQEVERWDKRNRIAAHLRVGDFGKRRKANIQHLVWLESIKYAFLSPLSTAMGHWVPRFVRQRLGLVTVNEVSAVFDLSGFLYSEQWSPRSTLRAAHLCRFWKRSGKKVIFLPQAFGPFISEEIKQAFRDMVSYCDLMFARDAMSYAHIKALDCDMDKVFISPDFTNLVQGIAPEHREEMGPSPCIIIPNTRMTDKTDEIVKKAYLELLLTCIAHLQGAGREVFILPHERQDLAISTQLQERSKARVNIVIEHNPLKIKNILGSAQIVIGSRFHGLVGSLSQSVPSVGTGWSHKYQMLFDDYGCSEFLLTMKESKAQVAALLDEVLDVEKNKKLRRRLTEASILQKNKVKAMWGQIREVLN